MWIRGDRQIIETTVTPPSRNDGVNQDHVEGFLMKREFTKFRYKFRYKFSKFESEINSE
jgi:hypothetical protein